MVLGNRDDIVPIKHVRRMIRKETSAHVMAHPYHAHADWTFDYDWQEETLAEFFRVGRRSRWLMGWGAAWPPLEPWPCSSGRATMLAFPVASAHVTVV